MSAPRSVAIITDGNGRWAAARGLPVEAGHEAGADNVKARLRDAVEFGISELTVFSFSTENWGRPEAEVRALMEMFDRRIQKETPELPGDAPFPLYVTGDVAGIDLSAGHFQQLRCARNGGKGLFLGSLPPFLLFSGSY